MSEFVVSWRFVDGKFGERETLCQEVCQRPTEVMALLEVLNRTEGVIADSVEITYPNGTRKRVLDIGPTKVVEGEHE